MGHQPEGRSLQSEMEPLPSGCSEDDSSIYSVNTDEHLLWASGGSRLLDVDLRGQTSFLPSGSYHILENSTTSIA